MASKGRLLSSLLVEIARAAAESMAGSDVIFNAHVGQSTTSTSSHIIDREVVSRFHREVLPGYAQTPLLQVKLDGSQTSPRFRGQAWIKCESDRYGLPAFKVLGAAFASFVVLCRTWGFDIAKTRLEDLQRHASSLDSKPTLVAATDGNHGRAVAFFAALVGIHARIYIPWTVEEVSERAIASHGAGVNVIRLKSDYDEAVKEAAAYADASPQSRLLIQDTAWEGYTEIPQLIVEGYQTIYTEIDEQLHSTPKASLPTHVICPVGVGSLAQSMVQYYTMAAQSSGSKRPALLSVEPDTAACLYESLRAGELQQVTTGYTVMPGLNCGTPSSTAWPELREGIAAGVKITDEQVMRQVDWLGEAASIKAGPCGGAPLAALVKLLTTEVESADKLGLLDDDSVSVVLLMTEGSATA